MRNLSILRDSVCAIDLKATDGAKSQLVRFCIESDTGNVYIADLTHGTVCYLSSNCQVGCFVCPITKLIYSICPLPQFVPAS